MATEPPSQETPTTNNDMLFKELDDYPWDRDAAFQNALAAFLGSNTNPAQAKDLILRAQCYYYARKKNLPPIDHDAYRAHTLIQSTMSKPESYLMTQASLNIPASEAGQPTSSTSTSSLVPSAEAAQGNEPCKSSDANPPYPVSFARIAELITSSTPIPGIRDIPPTVLSGQATDPVASKRLKPWEKNMVEGESTFGDRKENHIMQEIPAEGNAIYNETLVADNEHIGQKEGRS